MVGKPPAMATQEQPSTLEPKGSRLDRAQAVSAEPAFCGSRQLGPLEEFGAVDPFAAILNRENNLLVVPRNDTR